jgi:prepilin-type N-terminal cleavage/methylation domain-containing protein
MIKRETGFSLLELLMVMLIIGFVLAASSDMFVGLLRGYKQQSKIAETNIEGIIGLELLRRDIESAGYGLPWAIPPGTTYAEATNATALGYNDSPASGVPPTSSPPRAILSGDDITDAGYVSHSDYLVIKAINVARNDTCTKWALLSGGTATTWEPASENLDDTDRVIVISPGTPEMSSRTLVAPTGGPTLLQYSGTSAFLSANETRIVYGVAPVDPDDLSSPLSRPFNRADYYIKIPPASDMPGRCAQGTGILYKAVLNQANGVLGGVLPLLDCVADMQVVTYLDTNIPRTVQLHVQQWPVVAGCANDTGPVERGQSVYSGP